MAEGEYESYDAVDDVADPPEIPSTPDERTWAMLAHLSYLLSWLGAGPICWIAPLLIWVLKKDQSAFVEDQAREALNFQISVWLVSVVCGVTICLLPVTLVVLIGAVVYSIIAGMAANRGEVYRYPYTFRLIPK